MTAILPDDAVRLDAILRDAVTPRWLRELHSYLGVASQFVLYGNVRDSVAIPIGSDAYDLRTVTESLVDTLALQGYQHFCAVDPIHGITALAPTDAPDEAGHRRATAAWAQTLGRNFVNEFGPPDGAGRVRSAVAFPSAVEFAERVVHDQTVRAAIIFDYLVATRDGQAGEARAFARALVASYEARPDRRFNPIIWLADRENDLPPWLTLGNPRIRTLPVARPDKLVRRKIASSLLGGLPEYAAMPPESAVRAVEEFASQTDGMALNDLAHILKFCAGLDPSQIADGARSYKLGISDIDNPWRRMGPQELSAAEGRMRERVRGQGRAITKTLDIVRRALKGLSGAQAGGISSRPKGVLFFAGPTGVGKTELAKSLTEGLFGDERAYIRFDMSEFNHEHADQRLLGAPPGYVGFDAGGELTDAVRQRPCSVLLFDEIDKAHKKIFDKFLQILDEGHLTSGKGERVYFSDSIIIFTSNIGVTDDLAKNSDRVKYAALEQCIRTDVEQFFKVHLGRPELLNRIGDNIVVFDFIRPDVADEILDMMLSNVVGRVAKTQKIALHIEDPVRAELSARIRADLSNGGRGIGNMLESLLINPLGAALWDLDAGEGTGVRLLRLTFPNGMPLLDAERV
jgi:hypothetical protein